MLYFARNWFFLAEQATNIEKKEELKLSPQPTEMQQFKPELEEEQQASFIPTKLAKQLFPIL